MERIPTEGIEIRDDELTCVKCQREGKHIGMMMNIGENTNETTPNRIEIETCGHLVHYECYLRIGNRACPLCGREFNSFIPIVKDKDSIEYLDIIEMCQELYSYGDEMIMILIEMIYCIVMKEDYQEISYLLIRSLNRIIQEIDNTYDENEYQSIGTVTKESDIVIEYIYLISQGQEVETVHETIIMNMINIFISKAGNAICREQELLKTNIIQYFTKEIEYIKYINRILNIDNITNEAIENKIERKLKMKEYSKDTEKSYKHTNQTISETGMIELNTIDEASITKGKYIVPEGIITIGDECFYGLSRLTYNI